MSNQHIQPATSPNVGDALQRAWAALKPNIWLFLGFTVVFVIGFYVLMFLLVFIPLGSFLVQLLGFVYPVSLYTAFQAADGGREIEFGAFFTWTPKFGRLLLGSLIVHAIIFAIMIPIMLAFGVSIMNSGFGNSYDSATVEHFSTIWVGLFALIFPLGIVYGIVTFALHFLLLKRDLPMGETLVLSAKTGFRNFGPLLLYFLLTLGLFLLGCIPCGLGLLVTIPLIIGTQYFMLLRLFPDELSNNWDFEEPVTTPDQPYQRF